MYGLWKFSIFLHALDLNSHFQEKGITFRTISSRKSNFVSMVFSYFSYKVFLLISIYAFSLIFFLRYSLMFRMHWIIFSFAYFELDLILSFKSFS